jgi:hypothetical protein
MHQKNLGIMASFAITDKSKLCNFNWYSATAGHNQLWHIYHGKTKQTGQEVSVWVFDKSYLTKKNSAPIDKAVQEQILQIMRKDFNAMKDSSSENVISVLEVSSGHDNDSEVVMLEFCHHDRFLWISRRSSRLLLKVITPTCFKR